MTETDAQTAGKKAAKKKPKPGKLKPKKPKPKKPKPDKPKKAKPPKADKPAKVKKPKAGKTKKAKPAKPSAMKKVKVRGKGVVLLSGGNPQIAKAYGDAPVQAYIEAMPGWKSDVWRRLDALISRTVPDVYKAVKWNSPFYGLEGEGWFLGVHCFDKYIKVAFFKGRLLDPVPPVPSKSGDTRYLHIREDDDIDEAEFASWVKQASKLPGEKM
jgi:hypothetical protein